MAEEVAVVTERAPWSARRLAVLAILGMMGHGLALTLLGPVLPEIMRDFGIRETAVGLLLAAGSVGFTSGCLLSGFLVDRIGLRPALLGAWLGVAVSLAACGLAPRYEWLLAAYLLMGLGSGFIETGLNVLPTQIGGGATLMNVVHVGYGVGALAAPLFAGAWLQAGLDWRSAFWAVALVPAALVILGLLSRMPAAPSTSHLGEVQQPIGRLVRQPLVVLSALALLFYVAGEGGVNSWTVLFMDSRFQVSSIQAGTALSVYWGAILVGRLFQGLVVARYSLPAVVIVSGGVSAVGVAGMLIATTPMQAYLWAGLAGLAAGGIYPNIMVYANRRYSRQIGAVTGILSMAAAGGNLIFQPLVGRVAESSSTGRAMILLIAAMLGVGLCYLPVWLAERKGGSRTPNR